MFMKSAFMQISGHFCPEMAERPPDPEGPPEARRMD
jgi:hypothetical protein